VLVIGKLLFHGDGANLRDKPLTHRESH